MKLIRIFEFLLTPSLNLLQMMYVVQNRQNIEFMINLPLFTQFDNLSRFLEIYLVIIFYVYCHTKKIYIYLSFTTHENYKIYLSWYSNEDHMEYETR